MDRVPQFTKRDLNRSPSFEDLGRVYAALLPYLEQIEFNFKIVGGYACNLLGTNRDTKDLDFVLDLDSTESVRDVMMATRIPNLYPLGAGGGFGYLLSPSNLVEVDILDRRFYRTLQRVPDSIWRNNDPVIPIEWMLFIKLRTWGSRSQRVAPFRSGTVDPAHKDSSDVQSLVQLAAERNLSIPSCVIEETVEIVTRFIVQHSESRSDFQTLGFFV